MTLFEEKVYRVVRKVQRGKVTTYKKIARAIGSPNSSRAVGNALNKNPYVPLVPCHRVVKSDRSIGGYTFGAAKKMKILRKEGIIIRNKKITSRTQLSF